MSLFFWIGVFIVSLFVLIKASDYFTDAAEKVGLYLGMPAFLVGVTIVAVGTSLPELVSSIVAVLAGSSEIVIGNVVGSNIANIFLILGVVAIMAGHLRLTYDIAHVDIPIFVGSAFFLGVIAWDGAISRPEGLLALAGFIIYVSYTMSAHKTHKDSAIEKELTGKRIKTLEEKIFFILAVSTFFLYVGAKYVIDSVIQLSDLLNIGTELIAISAIALGTSLPELTASISAMKRGNAEMAVGNVLGSNIFNAFAVVGVPSLIGTLVVPIDILTFGLPMMLIATLLYFFITHKKEVTRWEGMLLIIFYIFFIGKLFNLL